MPDDSIPSAGWKAVYASCAASTDAEGDHRPCPDCGTDCSRIQPNRYWCPDHGTFPVAG